MSILKTKTIKSNYSSWLILSDIHAPFQNQILLNKIFKLIENNNFTGIILNGDFIDLFSLAKYSANSLAKLYNISLNDEYIAANTILDTIDKLTSNVKHKIFIYGNHENRYFKFLENNDNHKIHTVLQSPDIALNLTKRNYKVFIDNYYTINNNIIVTHGDFTNEHTAKKHLDMYQSNIIFGHAHRSQMYVSHNHTSISSGCLCNIQHKVFNYQSNVQRKKWSNGFVVTNNNNIYPVNATNNSFTYNNITY